MASPVPPGPPPPLHPTNSIRSFSLSFEKQAKKKGGWWMGEQTRVKEIIKEKTQEAQVHHPSQSEIIIHK